MSKKAHVALALREYSLVVIISTTSAEARLLQNLLSILRSTQQAFDINSFGFAISVTFIFCKEQQSSS